MSADVHEEQVTIDQMLDKIKQAMERVPYINTGLGEANSVLKEESRVVELYSSGLDASTNADEEVLELKTVVEPDTDKLSSHIQNFTQHINDLARKRLISEKEMQAIFREMLKPYLKSWLNSHMHDIVKSVLEEETRKIFRKLVDR